MIQSRRFKGLTVGVITALALSSSAFAAEKGDKSKKKEKTVADLIKDKTEYEGFLDFYQDPKTGSLMLVIEESQLNKPFIYHTHTVNGVLDAGHFKGAFRTNRLLEFRKSFDKIEIVSKTPRYILDENNAISRSEGTNISEAILVAASIEAHDKEKGQFVIKADPVLLSESLEKVSPYPRPPIPGQPPRPSFKVGNLSKSKTKYDSIRSYPQNTDVVVEYVFDNKAPMVRGSQAVSDPRTVTVQLQHSFIQLPENDYQPRRDDPRVGYFTQQFDDLSSNSWAPYRDVINRWNLVKKDPDAELSEPVEPIVWWIENTTPVEWRDVIKEAGEAWNIAFEKAGFKNALQVKVQPDDAEWDAGDIRYNVLRWTASPRPPFGGYGPSLPNPLTGEIIAADIMLEYSYFRNRWLYTSLFSDGASSEQMMPDMPVDLYCSAGHQLHDSMLAGLALSDVNDLSLDMKHKLVEQAMSRLILHEIGHTLGLNHNMKASQLFNATDVHDASKTQGIVTGSVMDYPSANIAPPGMTQGDYYDTKPGPYDLWVIEYGYSPALADADAEEKRLQTILSRSTEAALAFGNDAEDMRSPGRHIDPRVMIGDMSNEAVKYAQGRFELIRDAFSKVKENTAKDGNNYQQLLIASNFLIREWGTQAGVVSRYVGGVYTDRAYVGQEGATQPFRPVDAELQKEAVKTLNDYLFAPDVMAAAEPVYAYLQPQRRGFNGFGQNEDPKIHDMVLNNQRRVMAHLLHKDVLKRITDTALYGNEYSLNEYLSDLTSGIFEADLNGEVNTYRQNLQNDYVKKLIMISGASKPSPYDYLSQAAAQYQLKAIDKMIKYNKGEGATRVHREYLHSQIDKAFSGS
ncbi:zinc-dependent metalloprotease [Pleionea litopenaei]|uniref:Zinc-dependent metalloprotease n=1 Tax=Pleionea litopenaei TaxID=3070815 RepID=A0AA51RQZ1_9GAMM|nr:zinc-dependent metalloprotease [Pleionea sp. HL-JVS1]WMS86022.1 zinc-dependent metalloprotease [Pleionea sp. HL-JVS1]